jgi:hypothetical protein
MGFTSFYPSYGLRATGYGLYLIIDSDKHKNQLEKQTQRATNFKSIKQKGKAYVLKRSCLENYYHPRAFERKYGLPENSFPTINDREDAREVIRKYKIDNTIALLYRLWNF